MSSSFRFETLALHAGQEPDACTHSRAVPVYRTSSYVFRDTAHAADLFNLKEPGNIYSRMHNPTQDVLEKRLAALEGGAAALAHASGTAAVFNALNTICEHGDNIVSLANLYGGTFTLFESILPQFGITVTFVPPNDTAALRRAINARTRAIYAETIGNPSLDVADLEAIAEVARGAHLPLIVDSTFTTPYLLRPLEHGADVVVHSLTKWLGGHGTCIGGAVVDGGRFDWTDSKFRLLNDPDPSYHNLRWTRDLGEDNALAYIRRMRMVPMRNLGACLSPDNAWFFLQGLETLPLRMERHSANAQAVAEALARHQEVAWVRYPGLAADPSHALAQKYLARGCGGMVVFGIRGGAERGRKFIESLRLISHLANVGDAKSLALHPASTTHSQLTEEQQRDCGVTPDMIRLSIGLEHKDDILEDIERALTASW